MEVRMRKEKMEERRRKGVGRDQYQDRKQCNPKTTNQ